MMGLRPCGDRVGNCNCGDRVGILVEHAVSSGQHARLCDPRDLDDPLALLSLIPD